MSEEKKTPSVTMAQSARKKKNFMKILKNVKFANICDKHTYYERLKYKGNYMYQLL
jgi:hypothetical protein